MEREAFGNVNVTSERARNESLKHKNCHKTEFGVRFFFADSILANDCFTCSYPVNCDPTTTRGAVDRVRTGHEGSETDY